MEEKPLPQHKKPRIYTGKHRFCAMLLKNVRRDVKDAFKAYCSARGLTMTESIEMFMQRTVEGEERISGVQRAADRGRRSF